MFISLDFASAKVMSALVEILLIKFSMCVTVTLAVTRFAPGSVDCDYDYDGHRVSEANIKISWTWT